MQILQAWRTALRPLWPYISGFLIVHFFIRVTLFLRAAYDTGFSISETAQIFIKGAWFDIVVLPCVIAPVAFLFLFRLSKRAEYALRFAFFYILIFGAAAEHIFWSEFYTRFNFIAVDYLIYTTEVIGNISQSYPLPLLLALVGLGAFAATWLTARFMPHQPPVPGSWRGRAQRFAVVVALLAALQYASDVDQADMGNNAAASELAMNGVYGLFHAFWNNEIDYDTFYAMADTDKVKAGMRALLREDGGSYVDGDPSGIVRRIDAKGPEKRKNVVIVAMESMGANFMGDFGNAQGLTPNLDALSKAGISFRQAYATGTRSVRGLEALTLSLPPTPGQSILRRPGNDDLFSIGKIFKDRGYDTRFIYGGYGYFDNMNAFFGVNHFNVIDRTQIPGSETTFSNIWGVCDEDLFSRVVREADASFAAKKPFMSLVLTTSNHRPYTYPEGKIDIPSKTGRLGGVKYADYSIGQFIQAARKKPWFKDTIFVFVADHTAGASGKVDLDPQRYRIPLIFYAPGMIKPRVILPIVSQIDVAPTLLGLLNFSYYTKFYGENALNGQDKTPHAFISNYQKIALVRNGQITILKPQRKIENLTWPDGNADQDPDGQTVSDAINYYRSASWWRHNYKSIQTVVKKSGAGQ